MYILSHSDMMIRAHYQVAGTLCASDHKDPPILVGGGLKEEICTHSEKLTEVRYENMEDNKYVVRRLTPGQCARLQGFPDGWCDKVPHSDSAQYKMWGNGMCLPVILYCEQGMVDVIKQRREAEMNGHQDQT